MTLAKALAMAKALALAKARASREASSPRSAMMSTVTAPDRDATSPAPSAPSAASAVPELPDPLTLLRPRRTITGMSAILLPFSWNGAVDWAGFEAHVARTCAAGLVPAVNMDTGYVQLLDDATLIEVLDRTRAVASGEFVAGAFVSDRSGDPFAPDRYRRAMDQIAERGGLAVVFPSHGLNARDGDGWVEAHAELATTADRFLGFELGPMFVPYGRIYDLAAYEGLMGIEACLGAKHSSLRRVPEWERLVLRDRVRPDFLVLTGNDLAIDMVCYGSDYLLGLSTFAPDAFALRDRMWASGDPDFAELNDLLQYLGELTFRQPVPGYRHDAAMFLHLRGWINHDGIPDGAQRRPESDRDLLADIVARLERWVGQDGVGGGVGQHGVGGGVGQHGVGGGVGQDGVGGGVGQDGVGGG